MQELKSNHFDNLPDKKINFLTPILALWGIGMGLVLVWLWIESLYDNPNSRIYLLPWCLLTGVVIVAPSLFLYYKKKFDPFQPLIFTAWSFFIPSFLIGGMILTSGLSNTHFLTFVQDESYNLPLTLVYVMLGYGGLSLGYLLSVGRKIGSSISKKLPTVEWTPERMIKPALILLAIGLGNNVLAFSFGLLGFQRVEEASGYDGAIFLFTLFWLQASFLLWLCIFKTPKLQVFHYLIIGVLLVTSLAKSVVQGNRGSLIQLFIMITCAFVLSGRKIELKHKISGGAFLSLALIVGMIYGTTFRSIKTTEEQVSFEDYTTSIFQTFDRISDQGLGENLGYGFASLAERFDNVSPLAVVVSNYEQLGSYEELYGIDNNIVKELTTFFIPRMLWEDKPVTLNPYKYGDLYFDFDKNSFTLTPMGDLLRNFGPFGVPIGMMFLGIFMRIIYASLRENQEFSIWRATMFFMLLSSMTFEGTFSMIISYCIKVGFVAVIGLLIIKFFYPKLSALPTQNPA